MPLPFPSARGAYEAHSHWMVLEHTPPRLSSSLDHAPPLHVGAHVVTATLFGLVPPTDTFIGPPTATAVGGAVLSLLRALFRAVYRVCCRSTRGRFRLIGAALHVGPRAADGQHRKRSLGQGRRARLGGRGRKGARPWHTLLKFMKPGSTFIN